MKTQQDKKLEMQLLREAQNGNCERSFTQSKYEPEREATIKISLRPDRPFNPEQIHIYITPPLSLQEQLSTKEKLTKIYEKHTGKDYQTLHHAMERDNFMDTGIAKEFGLIDHIIESRKVKKG